jgi:hypothetical protein
MNATQNGIDIRYLRSIDYLWMIGALHKALNVIGAKPEVCDNLLVATTLSFSTPFCRSKSGFGILSNPSSVLDIGGCLLDMAFTIGFVRDLSNMPL